MWAKLKKATGWKKFCRKGKRFGVIRGMSGKIAI
jgi:hypothetical protein